MRNIEELKLSEIMPDSLTHDANAKAAADALDGQLTSISRQLDLPSIYANIDGLSSLALDHLAVQWDVSAWRDRWPVSLKRSVLKQSIQDKRKQGTMAAVKRALSSLGSSATITEWWQKSPKGTPHTFSVVATLNTMDGVLEAEMQDDIRLMIDAAKPLRSHYDFILQQSAKGGFGGFAFMRVVNYATLRDDGTATPVVAGSLGVVSSARAILIRRISATA